MHSNITWLTHMQLAIDHSVMRDVGFLALEVAKDMKYA
jgi:hypothetical protein